MSSPNDSGVKMKSKNKRTISMLGVIAIVLGFVAFMAQLPANADDCYTNSNGTTFCNKTVVSHSHSDVSTSVLSVASSDAQGKTTLAFEMANGFKTSASSCPQVVSFSKVPRGVNCFMLIKAGYHYQNSGVHRNGMRVYFDDYVGSKYTPVGSRFYLDAHNHVWRKANCGNFTRFSGTQPLKVANVVLVRTLTNVTARVQAIVTATGKVTSTASCASNGASASATATGTGTATATAIASASARTVQQASSEVASQLSSSVINDAVAKALAAASVDMESSASAMCQSSSTSTPTPTPSTSPSASPSPSPSPTPTPSQTPPSIVQYTTLNDVDAGGTSPNFCATVNVPGSDQGTLTFAATYGSFTTSTFAVAGQVQKCTTYTAPTEVPPGGKDTITVFVRDNTSGLNAQSPSQSFPINKPPAPPA